MGAKEIKYVIQHNAVSEVKVFKGKKGIFSWGYDSLGNKVVIQNKDAGDAIELMNVALSDDYQPERGRKILFFFLGLLFILFIVIVPIMLFNSIKKDETVTTPQTTQTAFFPQETPIIQSTEVIPEENKEEEQNKIDICENEKRQLQFSIDSQSLSYQFLEKENSYTLRENEKLQSLVSSLEEKVKNFNSQNSENKNLPQKKTSEEWFYFLGQYIYQECEKTKIEAKKQACKDLYFQFLQETEKK